MKIVFGVFSLSFFLFALLQHNVEGKTLEENCKEIVKPDLSFDFCMKVFEADTKSKSADLDGLAIISLNLTIAKAAYTKARAHEILDDQPKGGDKTTKPLLECVEYYKWDIKFLKWALTYVKQKKYALSQIAMGEALGYPRYCTNEFDKLKLESPLKQLTDESLQLELIPHHIVMLLGPS